MSPDDYTGFCKQIWHDLKHDQRDLVIMSLGLIGECGEVCEVILDGFFDREKLIEECGDVLYYMVMLADRWDYTFNDLERTRCDIIRPLNKTSAGLILVSAAKEVSERCKKIIRDGAKPNRVDMISHLCRTTDALEGVLLSYNCTLNEALQSNVKKMSVRYAEYLIPLDALHEATGGKL